METFTIEKTISIDASISDVFETLTDSEQIIQYYPLEEVVSDWQVGSEILFKGSIEGQKFIDYGKIDSLIPNQKFQYTYWSTNHGTARTPANHLTICYTLSETNQGTALQLEQKNIKSEQMYSQMLNVWDFLLSNFKSFVEKSNYLKIN